MSPRRFSCVPLENVSDLSSRIGLWFVQENLWVYLKISHDRVTQIPPFQWRIRLVHERPTFDGFCVFKDGCRKCFGKTSFLRNATTKIIRHEKNESCVFHDATCGEPSVNVVDPSWDSKGTKSCLLLIVRGQLEETIILANEIGLEKKQRLPLNPVFHFGVVSASCLF